MFSPLALRSCFAQYRPVSYTPLDVYKRQVMLYASPLLSVVVAADTVAPVCEVAVTANAVLTASADSVISSDAAGISTVARITLSPPASVLD